MAIHRVRDMARLAAIVALTAALGFLRQILFPIPNLELMTLSTFVGGAALGSGQGALAGAFAMGIFSLLNPLGPAPPPVFAAQVIGFGMLGAAGGAFPRRWRLVPWASGVAGFTGTLFYDVLTNLGTAVSMGAWNDPWPIIVGGIAFGVGHLIWNTALFTLAAPALQRVVQRMDVPA